MSLSESFLVGQAARVRQCQVQNSITKNRSTKRMKRLQDFADAYTVPKTKNFVLLICYGTCI